MAKIFGPPQGFDPPDFDSFFVNGRYDAVEDDKQTNAWLERLRDWCKQNGKGDLVGEVIRFPVADGYAQYMVCDHKPLSLIHLPIQDAWQIPEAHARGLRLADVRQMVEKQKRLSRLFGRNP